MSFVIEPPPPPVIRNPSGVDPVTSVFLLVKKNDYFGRVIARALKAGGDSGYNDFTDVRASYPLLMVRDSMLSAPSVDEFVALVNRTAEIGEPLIERGGVARDYSLDTGTDSVVVMAVRVNYVRGRVPLFGRVTSLNGFIEVGDDGFLYMHDSDDNVTQLMEFRLGKWYVFAGVVRYDSSLSADVTDIVVMDTGLNIIKKITDGVGYRSIGSTVLLYDEIGNRLFVSIDWVVGINLGSPIL